jgi:hypothetical protein
MARVRARQKTTGRDPIGVVRWRRRVVVGVADVVPSLPVDVSAIEHEAVVHRRREAIDRVAQFEHGKPAGGDGVGSEQSAHDVAGDRRGAVAVTATDVSQLGQGWVAEEALAIAVYCALTHPEDFAAAVRLAANHSELASLRAICGSPTSAGCARRAGRTLGTASRHSFSTGSCIASPSCSRGARGETRAWRGCAATWICTPTANTRSLRTTPRSSRSSACSTPSAVKSVICVSSVIAPTRP